MISGSYPLLEPLGKVLPTLSRTGRRCRQWWVWPGCHGNSQALSSHWIGNFCYSFTWNFHINFFSGGYFDSGCRGDIFGQDWYRHSRQVHSGPAGKAVPHSRDLPPVFPSDTQASFPGWICLEREERKWERGKNEEKERERKERKWERGRDRKVGRERERKGEREREE